MPPFERARQDPSGGCIRDQDRSLDNLTFALDTDALAASLASSGLSGGDMVAILLPNCAEIVTTMFAAWSLGAALPPVNPALTDPEAIYHLQDSETRVIIGDERAGRLAAELEIPTSTPPRSTQAAVLIGTTLLGALPAQNQRILLSSSARPEPRENPKAASSTTAASQQWWPPSPRIWKSTPRTSALRHSAVRPPSTVNSPPVAYEESSLARNTMMPSTSAAVPGRPSIVESTSPARLTGSSAMVCTSGVSV